MEQSPTNFKSYGRKLPKDTPLFGWGYRAPKGGGVLEREKMEREGGYMTIHVPIQ